MKITDFLPALNATLPATFNLLMASNVVVHPAVSRVVLHGSRARVDGYRPTSDLDLSLIVDGTPQSPPAESLLRDVLEMTRQHWQSAIELDLAVIFDTRGCELQCFDVTAWKSELCTLGGVDCFGLYKVGKGFQGLVTDANIQVKRMYPCLKIWQRG